MNVYDTTVYFIKTSEVYGTIQCQDFDTIVALREYFSFFADGYQFQPSFINLQWDGKIRLIDASNQIRLGLWHEVKSFCERYNLPFMLDPKIQRFSLDKKKFEGFVENLDVHAGGDSITPYDYQVDAAHHALESQRCLLLSPTSSGKSLIQYMLIRMYEKILPDQKMLIIVPTVGLVTQMQGDFNDYSSNIEWDAESSIHGIKAGVCKDTNKHIVVSTYQSLIRVDVSFFHQFSAIMCDEVHTATAKSITRILDNGVNASWRVGLTGTLDECKTNKLILTGMFGPVYTVISTKELMDSGQVAQLKVNVALLKHNEKDCKFMRSAPRGPIEESTGKKKRVKATYKEEIDFIISSEARNKFIMNFTAKLKGNSILMINIVEHGENLFKWMKAAFPDREIYLYTGATKADEREEIRQLMEKSENAIIIGSLGVLSTGISIKRLHNLVFAHPSKSRVKVLQSVGRLLRLSKFGNLVHMFDMVDDFLIGAYENYTYGHGQKRVSFYHDQQFDTEVFKVTL